MNSTNAKAAMPVFPERAGRNRTRSRLLGLLLIAALLPACTSDSNGEPTVVPQTERQPANVMSYRGASWLERPEREKEEHPDELLAILDLQPGDKVADIGCGSGFFTRRIAQQVGPEGRVYAVDVQPEMLEILEENLGAAGLSNVEPILSTQTEANLPPATLDWILLVDVYHEFQEPKTMLAQLLKSLAPGGRVALAEYRLHGDSADHIHIDHRMSVEQVLAEWQPAGFRLVEVREHLPTQHLFLFEPDR